MREREREREEREAGELADGRSRRRVHWQALHKAARPRRTALKAQLEIGQVPDELLAERQGGVSASDSVRQPCVGSPLLVPVLHGVSAMHPVPVLAKTHFGVRAVDPGVDDVNRQLRRQPRLEGLAGNVVGVAGERGGARCRQRGLACVRNWAKTRQRVSVRRAQWAREGGRACGAKVCEGVRACGMSGGGVGERRRERERG